ERVIGLTGAPGLAAGIPPEQGFPWVLTHDGTSLDGNGIEAIRRGRADGIDLIAGWTVDEYNPRWLGERDTRGEPLRWERMSREQIDRAVAVYSVQMPEKDAAALQEKIVTDQHFRAPAQRIVEEHVRRGGRG